jgi:BirA family biotin operon repressor/biotin-[acetyl-CoA-carboxylase] ligase
VERRPVVPSTNAWAREGVEAGARDRVAYVADRQTAGRGRGGRSFESPEGGLYVSAVREVPAADLPARVVGAAAVAVAEAIEAVAPPVRVRLKWPNDVWVEGKKAGGILVEAVASPGAGDRAVAVIGLGLNLRGVPPGLALDVGRETTALDVHASAPVVRDDLLAEWLRRLDDALDGSRTPAADLDRRYRGRAALVGERIHYGVGERREAGVLVDVSLSRGILVRPDAGEAAWRPMALVTDLRRAP